MGLRDLFRKYKNRHQRTPCPSPKEPAKEHQQIPQESKQNIHGLIPIEKDSIV